MLGEGDIAFLRLTNTVPIPLPFYLKNNTIAVRKAFAARANKPEGVAENCDF